MPPSIDESFQLLINNDDHLNNVSLKIIAFPNFGQNSEGGLNTVNASNDSTEFVLPSVETTFSNYTNCCSFPNPNPQSESKWLPSAYQGIETKMT